MLGAKIEDLDALRYPLVASYKLDGVRAIWWGSEFMSRTLKTIPNRALQRLAAQKLANYPRWDGELICGEPYAKDVYNRTIRAVMTEAAPANDLRFFVFDNVDASKHVFTDRLHSLHHIEPFVFKLVQMTVRDKKELLDFEASALEQGYEGLILRAPNSAYKQGRSTFREHGMLKLKRFHDGEAEVVGFEELMRNENPAQTDERGYTKRSSHQENKVPGGTLGALVLRMDTREFRVGTGFTEAQRIEIWNNRAGYLGRLAKFKSFPIGVKDLPRHPVFLGWRERIDL
jgi:DNA ligase-1